MATLNPGVAPDLTEEQVQPYLPPQPQLVPVGNTYKTSSVTGNLIPRDTYMQGIAALQDYQTKNRAIQEQELAQLQASAAALKQKELPVDLSALAALSDTWFGGNLAKSMQPKETAASRQEQLQQMNELISKARGKISDQDVELLKTQLSGEARKDEMSLRELARKDAAAEKRGFKEEERINKDVEAISKRKQELASSMTALTDLNGLMSEFPEDGDKLLPGYSATEKMTPDFILNLIGKEEGPKFKQKITGLLADVVKAYSGASAAESEVRRLAGSLGSKALTQTPAQLRQGLKDLNEKIIAANKAIEAGYHPEAVNIYKARGGMGSETLYGNTFGAKTDKPAKASDLSDSELDAQYKALGGK